MSDKAKKLPQFIDPFRLAEAGRLYDGDLSLQRMKRLKPLMERSANETVSLTLVFDKDDDGICFLSGNITGTIKLLCQRCLDQMDFTIDVNLLIAFLASEYDGEKLGGQYEPYIVSDTPFLLADIIEDELLLALPSIPKHIDTQCSEQVLHLTHSKSDTDLTEEKKANNPFSVLKDLNK